MKRLLLALSIALTATALSAQTATTSNVAPRTVAPTSAATDYRARTATEGLPTFIVNTAPNEGGRGVDTDVHLGSVSVTGGQTNVRVAWLPLLAPLPGSVPTTTSVMPDGFALTGLELPWRKGLRPARYTTNR